jgi:hypothetical protein
MTPNVFRQLALSLPNVTSGYVLGNDEFRFEGRAFATLGWPQVTDAMIKLTPADQARLIALGPSAFSPAPGGAGARGATRVRLAMAETEAVRDALEAACRKARAKS